MRAAVAASLSFLVCLGAVAFAAEEKPEAEESEATAPTMRELRAGLEELVVQIAAVRERLLTCESERQRLLEELAEVEKERDYNAEILEDEVAAASELRADLQESSADVAAVREELSELSRRLEESESERQRLAETAQALTEAQDLSTAKLAELVEENASMREFFELVRRQTMPQPEPEPVADQTAEGEPVSPGSETVVSTETQPETEPVPEPAPESKRSLLAFVEDWARAWSEQRVEDYLGYYSSSFRPPEGLSLADWQARRRERVAGPESIEVRVAILDARSDSNERAEVEVMQSYSSERLSDTVIKTLVLVREDGLWKIAAETTE